MVKKPIAIIEHYYGNNCAHLLIRIDELAQVPALQRYCEPVISSADNRRVLEHHLTDILKGETFTSFRLHEHELDIDILVNDCETSAFVFLVVHGQPQALARLPKTPEFFRWFANQTDEI